jgi:hypothetical protein
MLRGFERLSLLIIALVLVCVSREGHAQGAPIKVACIGGHTTHSHAFPAMNRETQPVGMQEYPAMLQTKLGAAYQVRNFGDCCGSVIQGYSTVGQETHPYVQGANAGDGPGYNESIAFLPDIVVIGSWGRHDWGLGKASTETWNLAKFQQDYDDLVVRYMNLSTHPRIFASLPVPILFGTDTDNGVLTSSVVTVIRAVAAKYNLPIVDLYAPFFGHMELYKAPPNTEGEGEHVTDVGLGIIADRVYAAMIADRGDGGTDGGLGSPDASGVRPDASSDAGQGAGAGGAPGSGGGAGAIGAGGSAGAGGAGSTTVGTGTGGAATTGAAGSATGAPAPGSSANGCTCRASASLPRATARTADLAFLGCLAIGWQRYRRRRTSVRRSSSRTTPAS